MVLRGTKTKAGERLKRLARRYALAYAALTWLGATDPADHEGIRREHARARKALHDAIDELTSEAPRAKE